MKNLILVNIEENVNKANELIRNKNLNNFLILYINNNILNDSFKHLLFDDIVKKGSNSKIYKEVRKFSKNWYKSIENELKYFNISLGELVEMNMLSLWPTLLKIDVLYNFIKKKKPSRINIITEYEEDIKIVKEIIGNKKIDLEYELFKQTNKSSFKEKIKKTSYNSVAKFQNLLFKIYALKRKKKNNILFLGNLRQTLPLLKKLKENQSNTIIRGGENLGRGIFTNYCDYYLTFNKYSNYKINKKIKDIKEELKNKFNLLKQKQKFYYKIELFTILEDKFKQIFLEDFVNLVKYVEIMKNFASEIDGVVTHIDILPFEKTVIKTANELKIPTLTMIEGFLPIKQIKQDNLFIPFYAQKIALYTEAQKEIIMKKYKISKDRLIVTGYPLFDQYYTNKSFPKEIIYKRYNIPSDKKIILYTAERYNKNKSKGSIWGAFTQKQCELIYQELFKSFKEFPELFLIIKKHPSGSLEDNEINKIADKLNFKNYIISRDMDICHLINASFAIITRQSNMGLEGMILGKYIIIMDTYFDTNDYFEYTKFNASLHAKKPGELKKALKSLIENKKLQEKLQDNMKKFINYNYSVNDGNSSERMAKLIQEITQKPYK